MSATFDAISNSGAKNNFTGAWTWTHTPVGTPTAVAVLISTWPNGVNTISAVTYNGVTCTQAALSLNGTTSETAAIFGLANPSSGPQTVSVSFSGNGNYGEAFAVTVTASDTTTCFSNASSTSTGSSTAPSSATTSAVGELVVDIINFDSGSAGLTFTAGGSQTKQDEQHAATVYGEVSTQPGAAGSVTSSWAVTGAGNSGPWAASSASFKAAAGATIATLGLSSGVIFTPNSGPTRQLRPTQAFPDAVLPPGFMAQTGMSQGFLFKPGAGPMWEIRGRSAFPDAVAVAPAVVGQVGISPAYLFRPGSGPSQGVFNPRGFAFPDSIADTSGGGLPQSPAFIADFGRMMGR